MRVLLFSSVLKVSLSVFYSIKKSKQSVSHSVIRNSMIEIFLTVNKKTFDSNLKENETL